VEINPARKPTANAVTVIGVQTKASHVLKAMPSNTIVVIRLADQLRKTTDLVTKLAAQPHRTTALAIKPVAPVRKTTDLATKLVAQAHKTTDLAIKPAALRCSADRKAEVASPSTTCASAGCSIASSAANAAALDATWATSVRKLRRDLASTDLAATNASAPAHPHSVVLTGIRPSSDLAILAVSARSLVPNIAT
jgi:hypothetical protein